MILRPTFSRFEIELLKNWSLRTEQYKYATGSLSNRASAFLATYGADGVMRRKLTRQARKQFAAFRLSGDFYFDVASLLIHAESGNDVSEHVRAIVVPSGAEDDFQFRKLRHIAGIREKDEWEVTVNRYYQLGKPRIVHERFPVAISGKMVRTNNPGAIRLYDTKHVDLRDAFVRGNGMVFDENGLWIGDPAADPCEDFVSAWWNQLSGHSSRPKTATANFTRKPPSKFIDSAIHGIGRIPSNYWHQIVEYIPAIAAAIDITGCKTVLWSTDAPSSALEPLIRLYPDLNIISVAMSEEVKVERVHLVSLNSATWDSPLRIPVESCNVRAESVARLYKPILNEVRSEDSVYYEKDLILTRGSKNRTVHGIKDFVARAKSRGFIELDPSKLSFTQQLEIFQNARTVASFGGAVWANLFFAHEDLQVLNFTSETMSWYLGHRAIAKELGIKFRTVALKNDSASAPASSFLDEIHSSFAADGNAFDFGLRLLNKVN